VTDGVVVGAVVTGGGLTGEIVAGGVVTAGVVSVGLGDVVVPLEPATAGNGPEGLFPPPVKPASRPDARPVTSKIAAPRNTFCLLVDRRPLKV